MKYALDVHTHTIASGHAYSTLMENAKAASEKGIKVLGTTEHGITMPHSPHIWYFNNYKVLQENFLELQCFMELRLT